MNGITYFRNESLKAKAHIMAAEFRRVYRGGIFVRLVYPLEIRS